MHRRYTHPPRGKETTVRVYKVGTSGLMTIYHRYTFDHFRDFSAHELAALRAS
eukprot:COSAG01_NODE_52146_length_348_cov_223.421687_1_plen_52_part_01